jgi:hypothetical protein
MFARLQLSMHQHEYTPLFYLALTCILFPSAQSASLPLPM